MLSKAVQGAYKPLVSKTLAYKSFAFVSEALQIVDLHAYKPPAYKSYALVSVAATGL